MTDKVMSIRLSSDGLSFWADDRPEGKLVPFRNHDGNIKSIADILSGVIAQDTATIRVYADTRRTVLVPEDLYQESDIDALMEVNNIMPGETDDIFTARCKHGITALIVTDINRIDEISSLTRSRIDVCSPFAICLSMLDSIESNSDKLAIYLTETNAYMAAIGAGTENIAYCDVLKWQAPEDILYYSASILQGLSVKAPVIAIKGNGAEQMAKSLGKYYKKVRCV